MRDLLKGKFDGLKLAEAVIIGYQNKIGLTESPEYKLLQEVFESIHEYTMEIAEAERSYRDANR